VRNEPASAQAWGRLGEVFDANDLEEQALICYAVAQELDPDAWRWPYLAGLLLSTRDPAAALEQLARAAELEPNYAALRFHLGHAHYLAENLAEAERHFRRALEIDAACINARLGLARVAVARHDPAAALPELAQAVATAPGEGAVHIHLAQVQRELGRNEEAEHHERLTALCPRPAGQDGMGTLLDPARDEVRQRDGVSAKRQLERARRHLAAGHEAEARAAIDAALAAAPESVPALVVSARLLTAGGQLEEARARIDRAIALAPDNAEAHAELGALRAQTGEIGAAIAALERAVALDPKPHWVKSNLAGLLLQAGRAEEALALLEDARYDQPDDADLRIKTATVLVSLGRLDRALAVLGGLVGQERGRLDALAAMVETGDPAGAGYTAGVALALLELVGTRDARFGQRVEELTGPLKARAAL
jgi:tetratricopeptide (TPR) repeat protein